MSQDALLVAIRNRLRVVLTTIPDREIEVTYDGRPHPRAGDWFVAVHEGEWRADESDAQGDQYLGEVFGVQVTVTRRVGTAPFDRIATELLAKESTGLNALCRTIVVNVHMSYTVLTAANTTIGVASNGFIHPLCFRDGGKAEPRGPAWFGAYTKGKQDPPAGLSRTLTFGQAQRIQRLESMT